MKTQWTTWMVAAAITLVGCQEGAVLGAATGDERVDVLAELEASSLAGESFGDDGLSAVTSTTSFAALEGGDVASDAPQGWGRRMGMPVRRNINVEIEGNTATVTKTLVFEGQFLLRNPTGEEPISKPANHTMMQTAVLQRLEHEETDQRTGRRRHWKLVALSPQEWVMTAADQQTVAIERLEIFVNGQSVAVIEDPSMLFELDGRIPRFDQGAEVKITARVKNYTGEHREGDADTWVYLHLFHARADARRWVRLPMAFNEATGLYERTWVVQQDGRERLVVDAIDAGSFALDVPDNYRANLWAIPYRVEAAAVTD
jgi:hypothetical protein